MAKKKKVLTPEVLPPESKEIALQDMQRTWEVPRDDEPSSSIEFTISFNPYPMKRKPRARRIKAKS